MIEDIVDGDFDNVEFEYLGCIICFFWDDEKYLIEIIDVFGGLKVLEVIGVVGIVLL